MHEVSLVRALLSQVGQIVDQHNATTATGIDLEIGPLSGVEVTLVQTAFVELVEGTRFAGATLSIQEVPLAIECLECGCESNLPGFVFRCVECDSGRVQVIRGDELRLLSVTVEEPVHA
jgi:hydrogenase nickel incorporation protein HypA/HybF